MLCLMLGVMTGNIDYMQPPIKMTPELRQISVDPSFQRMLKYAFVGSKATIKEKTEEFIKQTGVNEVIAVSHIYNQEDRINSFRLFSEAMNEM